NGLAAPSMRAAGAVLPEHVAKAVARVQPSLLFRHDDHDVAVYGTIVGVFAQGKMPRALDLSKALQTVRYDIVYGQAVGDVLVVELSRNGYARELEGKTAFIVAVGLDDGRLCWSSEPLVANAQSFVVAGSYVVSGYGFTAEPDALFVLELATGKVVQ